MTIAESLITWLRGYAGIAESDTIDTDQLSDELDQLGLFQAPGEVVDYNVDGSREVSAYFILRVRRQSDADNLRADSQEWLEALGRWVRDQNIKRALPVLDAGRDPVTVEISAGAYMLSQETASSVYQIGILLVYYEPKILEE